MSCHENILASCDIVRTKQIDIAEHEILLSFHSDEGRSTILLLVV